MPAPSGADDPGVSSNGDVTLTTGGMVLELGADSDVDLIADELTIAAQTGISGLEIAVNELKSVTATTGDIELFERDGAGERQEGLIVTFASAAAGSVSITANEYLQALRVKALGTHGVARLTSSTDNLIIGDTNPDTGEVFKPTSLGVSEDVLEYGAGVALSAANVLLSYRFFDADEHLEYRAGQAFSFDIPADLSADTIVLDLGPGLVVDGTLTATNLVELASDTNVYFSGTIQREGGGEIDEVRFTARGTGVIGTSVYDDGTGLRVYANKSDANDTVLFDVNNNHFYRSIMNGKYVFQGTYMPVGGDTEMRTYFADNAAGTGTLYTSANGTTFSAVADRSNIYDVEPHVWDVTGSTNANDYEPKVLLSSGGFAEVQDGAIVSAARYEMRAATEINITQNDDFTVTGFFGGIDGNDPTGSMYLNVDGDLNLTSGILSSSGMMRIQADSVTLDDYSLLTAGTLQIDTVTGMTLNSVADTIIATASGTGNITITEAGSPNLELVRTQNGYIDLTASGTVTATLVETVDNGNITLKSGADMRVDRIEAITVQGEVKTSGTILLDAYGQITEATPTDAAIDLIAYTITLKDADGSVTGIESQTPTALTSSSSTMNAGALPLER